MADEVELGIREAGDVDTPAIEAVVEAAFGGQGTAVNDVMAFGALAVLRERGLRVPEDVAVAGFDDIAAARDTVPALSTVHVDLEALGERAVAIALAGDPEAAEVLPVHPVLRASTGA